MPLLTDKKAVREIMLLVGEIGVPSQLIGCDYIRSSVLLMLEDRKYSASITKRLYPELAKLYEMSEASIERSIRNAIERTWERGNKAALNAYFSGSGKERKKRPTNMEFLIRMKDLTLLRLLERKTKEQQVEKSFCKT